jgi:hypothetical protein
VRHGEGSTATSRDPSGALFTLHKNPAGGFHCGKPGFEGRGPLDTSGGVFDMCVEPGTLEREELLAPGAVVGATLWLVGRPLTLREEPGPVPEGEGGKRRGFLRRLPGRRR